MNAGHHYASSDLSESNGILETGTHGIYLSVVRLHRAGVASDFVLQSTNMTFPFQPATLRIVRDFNISNFILPDSVDLITHETCFTLTQKTDERPYQALTPKPNQHTPCRQ
jgi:hypothetical protein